MPSRTRGDELDITTIRNEEQSVASVVAPPLALTVLHHRDLHRVGERAVAEGGRALEVSRVVPDFARDPGGEPRPLGDAHVSRRAFRIEPLGARGARIVRGKHGSDVAVNGEPLGATCELAADAVEVGAVLELAAEVVLLLHRPDPGVPRAAALGLVGDSTALHAVRARILRAAPLAEAVLVLGESGTGKELVATALHRSGPRAAGPFVSVNLAAVPPSMAAASLFGHARGAFTGAEQASRGYFGAADGGTLFLDEIGAAPLDVQAALLRALELGEVQPVGAERPHRVDVRVIAATDSDLEAACSRGELRRPLLERLRGYVIELPPLRARRDDVAPLLLEFLRRELASTGRLERLAAVPASAETWLPAALVAAATRHRWPGNVRQLRNAARWLVAEFSGAPRIACGATIRRLFGPGAPAGRGDGARTEGAAAHAPAAACDLAPPTASEPPRRRRARRRLVRDLDEAAVRAALAEHDWEAAAAAAALGVARGTLYKWLRLHGGCLRKAADLGRDEIRGAVAASAGDLRAAARSLMVSARALKLRMSALGLG
jgi:two-component system nitrogen regulation response regulator GlnG